MQISPDRNFTAKLWVPEEIKSCPTSGVKTFGLFQSIFFSGNLQNYSEVKQILRYCIAVYQNFVAVLKLYRIHSTSSGPF